MTLCLECCIMPKRLQHCNEVWSKAFVVKVLEDINQSQTHTQKQLYWKTHQPHHKHTLAAKHWGYTRDTLILLLVWPCLPLPDPPWPGKHNQLTHSTIMGGGSICKTYNQACLCQEQHEQSLLKPMGHPLLTKTMEFGGTYAKCKELELNLLQWMQCMHMVFDTHTKHTEHTDIQTVQTDTHTKHTGTQTGQTDTHRHTHRHTHTEKQTHINTDM